MLLTGVRIVLEMVLMHFAITEVREWAKPIVRDEQAWWRRHRRDPGELLRSGRGRVEVGGGGALFDDPVDLDQPQIERAASLDEREIRRLSELGFEIRYRNVALTKLQKILLRHPKCAHVLLAAPVVVPAVFWVGYDLGAGYFGVCRERRFVVRGVDRRRSALDRISNCLSLPAYEKNSCYYCPSFRGIRGNNAFWC